MSQGSQSRFGNAEQIRRRSDALGRFDDWQRDHPLEMTASERIAGVARLYSLLPSEARERPIDTSGVALLHRGLSALRRA
jgi:hypothetical protein